MWGLVLPNPLNVLECFMDGVVHKTALLLASHTSVFQVEVMASIQVTQRLQQLNQ